MEECRSAFKILTDNPTGKRPFKKARCRCIRMVLKAISMNMRILVDLAQGRDYW